MRIDSNKQRFAQGSTFPECGHVKYCERRQVTLLEPQWSNYIFLIGKEPFIEDGIMSEKGDFRRSKTWTSSVKHFVDLLETHPCTCHVVCIFQMPFTCSGPQALTFFFFIFHAMKGSYLLSILITVAVTFVTLWLQNWQEGTVVLCTYTISLLTLLCLVIGLLLSNKSKLNSKFFYCLKI